MQAKEMPGECRPDVHTGCAVCENGAAIQGCVQRPNAIGLVFRVTRRRNVQSELRFLAGAARPDVPSKRTLDQHVAYLAVSSPGRIAL